MKEKKFCCENCLNETCDRRTCECHWIDEDDGFDFSEDVELDSDNEDGEEETATEPED